MLSLLRNSFVNVRFQLDCIFFLLVFYFDCFFEDWPIVCLLYFVLSFLDILFILFLEIIVRLIFWVLSNLLVMIQAKGWKHYEYCLSSVINFVMHCLGSALCLVSHFNKQSAAYDFLKILLKF